LFLGLLAVKFAAGTVAYSHQIRDGAGPGQIMVTVAIPAEIMCRHGQQLAAGDSRSAPV
jgi:hypothetical protein